MPRFDRETFYFPSIRLHFSSIPPIFFSLFLYFTFIRARVETREKMKNESTKTKKEKEREREGNIRRRAEKRSPASFEVVSVISPRNSSVRDDSFLRLPSSETFPAQRSLRNWPTGGWRLRSQHSNRQGGTGNCLFVPNTTTNLRWRIANFLVERDTTNLASLYSPHNGKGSGKKSVDEVDGWLGWG